jgi:hypothetical protein
MRGLRSSIVLLAWLISGAALADEPYAVIDGTDWPKTEAYAAPVQIASIDGTDYIDETRRTLAPGKHRLEFVTTRKLRAAKLRQTRVIEIELEPCTVYYYYALHPSKYAPEWELKLMRTTELKKCKK